MTNSLISLGEIAPITYNIHVFFFINNIYKQFNSHLTLNTYIVVRNSIILHNLQHTTLFLTSIKKLNHFLHVYSKLFFTYIVRTKAYNNIFLQIQFLFNLLAIDLKQMIFSRNTMSKKVSL